MGEKEGDFVSILTILRVWQGSRGGDGGSGSGRRWGGGGGGGGGGGKSTRTIIKRKNGSTVNAQN